MAVFRTVSYAKQFLSGSARLLCSLTQTTLRISEDQRKLQLHSSDHDSASYHGVWLRHNCRCPECYSASTNMMTVTLSEAASCKVIKSAKIENGYVIVRWFNSNHEGLLPLKWLKDNEYSSEESRNKEKIDTQLPLVIDSFPISDFTEVMESDEAMYKWLKDINYYGVSLIKGINEPQKASGMLASKFPHLLHFYGEPIYNVIHKEDIDDLGEGTGELALHQDLLYYENPPGLQILNCVRNDPCVTGGESIFVDLYPVVMEMRYNYREYFDILTKVPVTFQRKIMGAYEKLNLRMARHHIQLDRFGEVAAIHWNIAHPEPLCIEEDLVEGYYDAISTMERLIHESPYKLVHRLVPGECIGFNNRRMVHGRKRFTPNGGKRHLDGFYAHTDFIRSHFLVLGEKLGKNEPSANIFTINI